MFFKKTAVLVVMFLTAVAGLVAQVPTRMVPAGKPAASFERARMQNALRASDVTVKPTSANASHVAMVVTAGVPYDDWSLSIVAIAHRTIPAGSLIGLRIRRDDGTTYLDGVQKWDDDITPGQAFSVKSPGGGTFFGSTKQYEFIVVDSKTLETTVDYVPVFEGNVIQSSPSIGSGTGSRYLIVPLTDAGGSVVNAVVVGGNVVDSFFTDSYGRAVVNLTKAGLCFGDGDVSVTIVRGGKSDTTTFRFGSQGCQAPPTVPQ